MAKQEFNVEPPRRPGGTDVGQKMKTQLRGEVWVSQEHSVTEQLAKEDRRTVRFEHIQNASKVSTIHLLLVPVSNESRGFEMNPISANAVRCAISV